ncbi:hypothetical protein [Bacillus sp. 2205SS5-2]|uniref:hypothetical protein n=1 Tax=Bacillus sp. 2205SS5-2 TaxID=3109031 RepID=UPI0030079BC7
MNRSGAFLIGGLVCLLGVSIFLFRSCGTEAVQTPESFVKKFYSYEEIGDFGSSWELFHPFMKDKFGKDKYIERKAHVFMHEMGATTFTLSVGEKVKLTDWKYTKEELALSTVYKIPVTLTYDQTQFGVLSIGQTCYVVEENGKWEMMWEYREE